ncbi:helix-turn-helix domain-containing protein [Nocardia donostiensis]|uniref:Cro/Cl family transcriptional regulator n=1 Tax=Nocardia donostiensis TaxID=1538463 RepID=A0A1W0B9J7_9NOCA|nr:helix-turn-helix transcriptional regulator [Nocardia donostiensis]ONM49581.1 Cro/Cl family transcriptional regulator [Nocardia donostiensis]OQS19202.1 Cro/Cl family transcriptional regulator [Nocardia donostiensis]
MTEPGRRADPNALRFLIGRELKTARERARVSQTQAGQQLDCTPTKINYLESGKSSQDPAEVTVLLRYYGTDPAHVERIAALAGQADQTTWWAPFGGAFPNWFKTFVGLEGLAESQWCYTSMHLPGQLQTPEYALALLDGHLRVSPADAPGVVRGRMARQRLTGDPPLRLRAIIEEYVLDRIAGGPDVMAAQLQHLLSLMKLPTVELHVMPVSVPVHDGLDGDFIVLNFESARSIGYIEYPAGALYVQEEDQVELYKMATDRLCAKALSETDSARTIERRLAALDK